LNRKSLGDSLEALMPEGHTLMRVVVGSGLAGAFEEAPPPISDKLLAAVSFNLRIIEST
jgi:hypothetical protein